MKQTLKATYEFFASLKLTIALLIALSLACAVGTFFDLRSGFKLVYHAPWFMGLEALFALNLALCTFRHIRSRRRWPVGFLLLHLGVLVVLGGGLWGFLATEKGILIVSEGQAADEYWTDTSYHLPADPKLRFVVKPGQRIKSGDVIATAPDRSWTYTDEHEAIIVKFRDHRGGYIRGEDGRYVVMLRKIMGRLPFKVVLEKFWIEYHPKPKIPKARLVVFGRDREEPEVTKPKVGLSGDVAGVKWEVLTFTTSAMLNKQIEGEHRLLVSRGSEASVTVPLALGKVFAVKGFDITVRPLGFFRNAMVEPTGEGGFHLVEEKGGRYNPAVEIEVTYPDGSKKVHRVFRSARPSMHGKPGAMGSSSPGKMPPGAGKMPPGHGKMPPGAGKMPPGAGKMPPGSGKMPPGHGKMPPDKKDPADDDKTKDADEKKPVADPDKPKGEPPFVFLYRPQKVHFEVEGETGGETVAVRLQTSRSGETKKSWLFLGPGTEGWAPFPEVRFLLADMYEPMPKSYKSKLSIFRGEEPVTAGILEVNRPIRVDGFWLYQRDYDHEGWRYTVLDVVRDPGVWLSFAGLALVILGAFVLLCFEPLKRWREREGAQ